jgi:type II secretory pathway pseudopilin PulG
MVEAVVVMSIFAIVATAATMGFVGMLKGAKRGRGALQAMTGTRAALDFVLDEARSVGGLDLPPTVRVLVAKGAGQKRTDLAWLIRQNAGYDTCAITNASGSTLTFSSSNLNGEPHCCFEANAPTRVIPDVAGDVPAGAAFRRTAVITDLRGRFLPVFLSGDPSASNCRLTMTELPNVASAVNTGIGNRPDIGVGSTAILADVKRVYVDYAAEGAKAPFGVLYVQNELDGDVLRFDGERQRLASNVYDLRFSVGYGDRQPQLIDDEIDEDDDDAFSDDDPSADDGIPDIPEGNNPLLERAGDRAGWRDTTVPIVVGGEEAPAMLGVAIQTGVGADTLPPPLPWSTTPLTPREAGQVMSLTGRVTFRSEGAQ